MKSIADQLPPEIARQIHPDWRKNEAQYWAVRDQLLGQYKGQWIGFADGAVIASGTSPVEVLHTAQQSGRHPFVICVGREEEPCRIRRCAFPYDTGYPGEPLPTLSVEFRETSDPRHGRRCQRLAVGGLSAPPTRSDPRCARLHRRSCRRFHGVHRVSDLGSS
jgi:hypothetical protein